ncbi:mavicyanin-like [Punica granatum]|uniref:Phytocyanin domain-containing protein n=2 Tax=Punica granatum TaxID=22663 RepID=A0A218XLR0_PUNGR|nr:mavicyanin-like [Punica granatum]OWM85609.1 hypothetical protein CDL15_Pgr029032 [Punica granatum]PKI37421.1 hypothetical protein CRG98_042207 [Punica granatum]
MAAGWEGTVVAALLSGILMAALASPAGAQVHHVVGGDVGWDPSSDIASWAAGRIFSVGDKIWFAYSAAQESIVELRSKEEYESCDVANPIRMYKDGIDAVLLEEEGIRYFASSRAENCKSGLRLPVAVHPPGKHQQPVTMQIAASELRTLAGAAEPTSPSGSHQPSGPSTLLLSSLFLGIGLWYWAL